MRINEALILMTALVDANVPVMLHGAPGIGKSDLVRQFAASRKWNCLDSWRASTLDVVDMRGVPDISNGRTKYNPPDELPDAKRDGKFGIMFLDEINSGTKAVQAAMFQLVLDGKVGSYRLPANWRIVAAGNRVSDRAAAQTLTSALADRFSHIDIDVDFETWKVWAITTGNILPEIIAFLAWCESRDNSLLHKMPEREARAFPTPRSWGQVSKACAVSPGLAFQIASACVGEAAAAEFKGFLEVYRDLPKLADIYADPTGTRVPLEPSAMFAVSAALARNATAQTLAATVEYLKRMPVEFSVMSVTDAVRRDVALKSAPGFSVWAVANQHVTL